MPLTNVIGHSQGDTRVCKPTDKNWYSVYLLYWHTSTHTDAALEIQSKVDGLAELQKSVLQSRAVIQDLEDVVAFVKPENERLVV